MTSDRYYALMKSSDNRLPPSAFRLPFWLALFLFAVYLLSFSGKFHVMDELAVFTAGHSLASHNRADINPLIWTNHWTPNPPGLWGVDNQLYTKKAPGISLLVAPLLKLGLSLPGLNVVQVGLLTNSLVTALTAALLFVWLAELGFLRRTAALAALVFGLGTVAWVYARMFWESSLLGLFFLLAVWAAQRATQRPGHWPSWGWLLVSGLAGAVGISLRFEAVVAVGLVGLYLLWSEAAKQRINESTNQRVSESANPRHSSLVTRHSSLVARLLLFLLPSILIGLWLVYFNLTRFGSLGETGYTRELLFTAPWVGSYGLLFSPGRGLFIYSPLLLLLFFGLRPAWRRVPRAYFWLIVALCLFYWLFYGSWFAWGGTWGWGPRFLLPILPLLLLFVAPPLEWAFDANRAGVWPARLGIGLLAVLSIAVNLLGLAVDFNEHFLRLGRNDDFVFNWAAFPPLGHWRILQEGLVDLLWLQPSPEGLAVQWALLLPSLALLALALLGLGWAIRREQTAQQTSRLDFILPLSALILAFLLVFAMLRAAAQAPWAEPQAQLDAPLLATLAEQARPGDALLLPMPPFGDVQEVTTRLLAYLSPPLPIWAWIDSPPRGIEPDERARVLAAARADSRRVWLFERWLTQTDPTTPAAAELDQSAFPVSATWFERSGRLSLFLLPGETAPAPLPLTVPFRGGLTLAEPQLFDPATTPGGGLRLRLNWRLAPVEELSAQQAPLAVIASVQLLDDTGQRTVAQQDRLLVDLQQVAQSPLLPGQTVAQGYGLLLPADLPAGAYPLVVSLYRADTGERLPRADASPDDFLYLTSVTVQP
ncbi:MAG: hypothetical protein FOGNACKC_00384 [Anaerolineae bacterium]|nr:hypothetical protein [Anaerolineae bacterium]